MDENNFISDKIKKYIIFGSLGCAPLFFIGIALFVTVFLVLGLFDSDDNDSNTVINSSECGFTISSTSLSKNEFKSKLEEFASSHSSMKIFANNADNIYDLAMAYNRNPELVVIRAWVEGGGKATGSYNYWGIGCYNGAGLSACNSYGSFNKGVVAYLKNISKYDSLKDMMSKYAYIGKYWYNPGSSSLGGCYYAEYIYPDGMPSRVAKACREGATCSGSSCVKTKDEDQEAYAEYQVNNMAKVRKTIFGLESSDGVECTSDIIESADINKLINMTQSEAWEALIGKKTNESNPYISESSMNKRVTTVSVPIRTWKSGSGHNPRTDTKKKEVKIEVNKALAGLWQAFFTDVYNNAPDFVIASMDGCYKYRPVTGGSSLSAHAYGVACDINASTPGNGYGQSSYSKSKWEKLPETRAKYQVVYKGSKVMEIAHKYTLINGSDWNNPNDAMHFSFIRDKTRSFAQSCQGKAICS